MKIEESIQAAIDETLIQFNRQLSVVRVTANQQALTIRTLRRELGSERSITANEREKLIALGPMWKAQGGHKMPMGILSTCHLQNILDGNFGTQTHRDYAEKELERRAEDLLWHTRTEKKGKAKRRTGNWDGVERRSVERVPSSALADGVERRQPGRWQEDSYKDSSSTLSFQEWRKLQPLPTRITTGLLRQKARQKHAALVNSLLELLRVADEEQRDKALQDVIDDAMRARTDYLRHSDALTASMDSD